MTRKKKQSTEAAVREIRLVFPRLQRLLEGSQTGVWYREAASGFTLPSTGSMGPLGCEPTFDHCWKDKELPQLIEERDAAFRILVRGKQVLLQVARICRVQTRLVQKTVVKPLWIRTENARMDGVGDHASPRHQGDSGSYTQPLSL
jgi:hypothetical protein